MMRFFRLSVPTCADTAAGGVSLKKPHHIKTLWFSEVVKDHAKLKYMIIGAALSAIHAMSVICFEIMFCLYLLYIHILKDIGR